MIMIEMRLLRLTPISWWYQGLGKWEQTIMNPVQMLSACSEQISPWEIITEINLVLPSRSKISLSSLPETVSASQQWHQTPPSGGQESVLRDVNENNLRADLKFATRLPVWQLNHWRVFGGRGLGSDRVWMPLGSLCCYAVRCQMAPEYRGREQFINT